MHHGWSLCPIAFNVGIVPLLSLTVVEASACNRKKTRFDLQAATPNELLISFVLLEKDALRTLFQELQPFLSGLVAAFRVRFNQSFFQQFAQILLNLCI
jgi:hypothetical protein